mmetsp:Transcript_8063/g.24137  ORF Transcript_8063/g.24137 Transcript_8063/m.24137 type:complete len:214 (+) Transcript_8063:324-965(+)
MPDGWLHVRDRVEARRERLVCEVRRPLHTESHAGVENLPQDGARAEEKGEGPAPTLEGRGKAPLVRAEPAGGGGARGRQGDFRNVGPRLCGDLRQRGGRWKAARVRGLRGLPRGRRGRSSRFQPLSRRHAARHQLQPRLSRFFDKPLARGVPQGPAGHVQQLLPDPAQWRLRHPQDEAERAGHEEGQAGAREEVSGPERGLRGPRVQLVPVHD